MLFGDVNAVQHGKQQAACMFSTTGHGKGENFKEQYYKNTLVE